MRFLLFSFLFIVFWMPQKKGKPKKAAPKGGKPAKINLPTAGANDSSSDDDNAAGPVVPEGPAGVVRTNEVLAEPLLKVTVEGFTKEVVRLEDGDLNQWPQLSVRIENLLTASEKDGVVHVAVVYDATCVRLPLTPGSLTTVAHTAHRLLGSKVSMVAVVIGMCRADSDMIHRLISIGCGNGPQTANGGPHTTFQKNQWDTDLVDRPLCRYLQRKGKVTKPTTAHAPLRYKGCKGQEWVGQGPMVAVAAAQLHGAHCAGCDPSRKVGNNGQPGVRSDGFPWSSNLRQPT